MAARQFSNIAVATTLSSGIAAGAVTLTVVSATGWPAAPFILVIEPDLANEELILVGAKAGAVFSSLTRGFGGTSDVAHSAADVIKHVSVAEDHSLIFNHVHVPGTDDTAQLSHDDLSGVSVDDHHNEAHTVVSHSDTGATGAELDTLTDGSDADALHVHSPDWQAWSPTYANLIPGNGTVVARYVQIGKLVIAQFDFTLGSTSAVGTTPTISMPVTEAGNVTAGTYLGMAWLLDSGVADYQGVVRKQDTTRFDVRVTAVDGTYATATVVTALIPFTWTTGDVMAFTAVYEAA